MVQPAASCASTGLIATIRKPVLNAGVIESVQAPAAQASVYAVFTVVKNSCA